MARSNIFLLNTMGARVRVVAPSTLLPPGIERFGVEVTRDMREGLSGCDIVMMLRLQLERMTGALVPSTREYFRTFGLTRDRLRAAGPVTAIGLGWAGQQLPAIPATATDERVRRQWFGGRLDWITPLGWTFLGLSVVLWVLSALLGWAEPAIIAATMLALVVVCVLLSIGSHRADVELVVEPLRAEIGDLAQAHVVLTNSTRRTMLPSLVRLPVGDHDELIPVPLLRKGAQHRISFPIATPRRGVIPVGPAKTVQGE